tara:strand:+ start:705 stop:1472 length:768 start_codon:yes stop_codon:yes gene_type:complete
MGRSKQVAPRSSSSLTAEEQLLSAVCDGNLGSIRELLAGGASVNAVVSRHGTTPLLQAVRDDTCEGLEIVRALIKGGADPNIGLPTPLSGAISIDNGDTPLLAACYNGNVEIAEDLISAGADVHGTEQGTPLSMVMNQMDDAFLDQIGKDRLRSLLQLLRRSGATSAGACAQPLVCLRPWHQPRAPPVAESESILGHGSSRKRERGVSRGVSSSGGLASSLQGTATLHSATVPAETLSRADRLAARQARAAINQG